jgi:steroid 5-alpha reductase family enzyme
MPHPLLFPPDAVLATAVYPNFGGVGGAGQLASIVGALLTLVLIVAVLMLIVCAVTWAISNAQGNYQAATRARTGLWVAVGAAALAGAGATWVNFLIHLGSSL